jgi:GNAT superfamily N-acetyltransferase
VKAAPHIHCGYRPGCIGRVTSLHADYYSRHSGFGAAFEGKVARELSALCEGYVEGRDGLWLALDGDSIEGSVAIDGSHAGEEGAHLRWFIVSDRLRGSGAGAALLTAAMDFCRERYDRAYLWTFEGLHAARHLYEKAGFTLANEQRGARWGSEVNEQRFEWVRD